MAPDFADAGREPPIRKRIALTRSTAPPPSTGVRAVLPMLGQSNGGGGGISRSADRQIAFGGLAVSAVFMTLAIASLLLPPGARLGFWLAGINAGAALVTLGFGPAAGVGSVVGHGVDLGATLLTLGLGSAGAGIGATLVLFALAARRGPITRYVDYGPGSARG